MAISCEQAKTWAIVFGVYSGILTGVIIGFLFLWFLKRKKTIPKAKKKKSPSGIDNAGFAETGLGVTPERLREDLSAQRRNRQDATPIPARREGSNPTTPSVVAESYPSTSVTIEPDGSRPVTYLELSGGPVPAGAEEFASLKSSESASTLYDDVQSIGSKSKTSLREARNSVSSANAVFYDAKDVDSVMLEDSEKIYQEIPDPKKIRKSSSSSSSSTTVEELYDDAQVVTRRSKKKAAPPPPPPKPKRVIEDIYDDIELQVRKSSNPQDLEDARKSYQEAPEKYRKPSNYIDLESKGDSSSPLVKKEIEKMISTLGEVQSSSSSSSSSESESSKPETFQRRKSSYSSPSEVEVQEVEEEADVFSINTNPISIDSDEGSEKVQKMPAPLRRVANVDLGSSLEQALEGDLSDSGTSDSDTTTSGSETLDESEEGSKFEPPKMDPPELKNAIELLKEIEPEMIELKQAVELDLEPEMPTVQHTEPLDHFEPETVIDLAEPEAIVQPKSSSSHSSSHSSSSSNSEDEQQVLSHEPKNFEPEPLIEHRPEFATQVIDEGHEVHLCTPVVVRTDDSSSEVEVKPMTKITEESTSESSTSEESSSSAESSSSEPGKESQPKLERKSSSSSSKLRSKSSSRSSSKLEIKPQSSSSSSEDELQVQSNGVDHMYANLPPRTSKSLSLPRRKRSSSSSSNSSSSPKAQPKVRPKLKTRNSDISDSFLRNLNRNYQPVYYLRKVNSETQTDKGAANSTEA